MTRRLVLSGGQVVDGSGAPPTHQDIAIEGGKIAALGGVSPRSEDEVLDCRGMTIAPGFIDLHTHSDLTRIAYPDAATRVLQGVTTEVIGNCGLSPSPVGRNREELRSTIGPIDVVPELEFSWTSMGEYLDTLDTVPGATHLVPLIGHGSLRYAVMGLSTEVATPEERDEIVRLLEEALDLGFWGMSFGFMYAPGESSDSREIDALAQVLSRFGALMSVHMRAYDLRGLASAVREIVGVAERTGVATEISHLRSIFDDGSALSEALDLITGSSADIQADAYPYTAGHTTMLQMFPSEIRSQGTPAILRLLTDDPSAGAQMLRSALGFHPDNIIIAKAGDSKAETGATLSELSDRAGGSDPALRAVELLLEHAGNVDIIIIGSREEDAARVLREPYVSIASDGVSLSLDHAVNLPHPRSIGTFPRAFRQLVDEGVPIEEVIRKMTAQPAQRIGLRDRGRIAEGMAADVVVFDPDLMADRATYATPLTPPSGVRDLLVSGEFVLRGGSPTGSRPGRLIRRTVARA